MRRSIVAAAFVMLLIMIAVGFLGNSASRAVMAKVQDTMVQELNKALETEVSVGQVEVTSFNQVTLHHTTIKDKKNRVILDSEKITVSYDPIGILRGMASVEVINKVVVTTPKLNLTQSTDGKWNIEDLRTKEETKNTAFKGKVVIEKGKVEIYRPNGQWNLEEVEGTLDFGREPSIKTTLAGLYEGVRCEASGTVTTSGNGVMNIKTENLPLLSCQSLLSSKLAVHITGGSANYIDATVKLEEGKLSYAGEAKFSKLGFDYNEMPIRDTNGLVTFNNDNIHLYDVKASIKDQLIKASGLVNFNSAEPQFDLNVASSSFEPMVFEPDFIVKGPLAFEAHVTGTTAYPILDGQLSIKQGEIAGYALTSGKAKLHLAGKKLEIQELSADALGGQVDAVGIVNLADNGYGLRLKGSHIDSAYVAEIAPYLQGRGDVDLYISQQGKDMIFQGTAEVGEGILSGVQFDTLSTSFYKKNNDIVVDYFNLKKRQGMISVYGDIKTDIMKLYVRGQGVPLDEVSRAVNGLELTGKADFSGNVEGTVSAPMVFLDFTAKEGQAYYQPFAKAKGSLGITSESVTLHNVELTNGPTVHKVKGSIGLTGSRELNLEIHSRKARAENLVQLLLPDENLTGNVDNDVVLTGPVNNFSAVGKMLLTEGSFRGHLISRGGGSYERVDGITHIQNFAVQSLNSEVKLNGIIGKNNDFNLNVKAEDIDIARMHVNFPYPVAGKISFNGQLQGVADNPVFTGEMVSSGISLNGQKITDVSGRILVNGNQIDIARFGFKENGGTFAFAGGVDVQYGGLHGTLNVENGELAGLLPIFNVKAKGITGRLNGYIGVSGTTAKPSISITGGLTKGKIKNYSLDNIDIDLSLDNNIVTVSRFEAKQGDGVLAVRGTADLSGPLDLQVGGRNMDAGLLTAWLESDLETIGKMDFAAQVSGTMDSPKANVSLEIKNGGVANANFDALYGLLILDQGSINVNQLMLKKGPYRASAYGVIPYKALNPSGREQASEADHMNLKVRLDEANLKILPVVTSEVAWAEGQTKGEVVIGGTLAYPTIFGNVEVTDGTVKLKSLADPIQKVGVDIRFEGDKINIKTVEGYMGAGSVKLSGGAALKGLSLDDYNLSLVLDKFGINHKYFRGPLNGTLVLKPNKGKPYLTGKLIFENDTIDIPGIPELKASNLDVGLDLELVAGKKVRLYNAYLYDIWASGKVKFAGTTQKPDVSGRFTALRGTVSYLRTQFKITSGSAQFTQYGSFEPVIKLDAETKLADTTVKMNLNGPVMNMHLTLTSEPSLSQQEILSLLTLRSRYFEKQKTGAVDTGIGRDELVGLLDAGLQMRFISTMEGTLREVLNLDEFRLVRDTLSSDGKEILSDREVYNLEIGKYVTDRLYLNYTVGLGHEERSLGARYDLSRRFSITSSVDEKNRTKFGIEARFTFK